MILQVCFFKAVQYCKTDQYFLMLYSVAQRKKLRSKQRIVRSSLPKLTKLYSFQSWLFGTCFRITDLHHAVQYKHAPDCLGKLDGREEESLGSYVFNSMLISIYGSSQVNRSLPNMINTVPKFSQISKSLNISCTLSVSSGDRKCKG